VGAALTIAGQVAHHGHPVLAAGIHHAATQAYLSGFTAANLVAAGVAAAGAVMALALLPAHPGQEADEGPQLSPLGAPEPCMETAL
jgi:hypothetical protein